MTSDQSLTTACPRLIGAPRSPSGEVALAAATNLLAPGRSE
jgi:hypothetical protein